MNKWLHYGIGPVVGVDKQPSIPEKFELAQNYPNPFNPTTVIGYQIPSVGTRFIVSLKIYDLLGQEITTLFDGIRQPGKYEATFDGNKLASGVYFYQLKAGNDFSDIKKMILLR